MHQKPTTISAKEARRVVREWPRTFFSLEDLNTDSRLIQIASWYLNKAKRDPHPWIDELLDRGYKVTKRQYLVVLKVMRDRECNPA